MAQNVVSVPTGQNIDSILQESRTFPPPPEFSKRAHIKSREEYDRIRQEAEANPEAFWDKIARELHWFKPWSKVLEWNAPWAKWFVGGEFNLSYNCLDRHVATWRKNKAALIWEGEPGEQRTFTYQQLLAEVQKFANVLGEPTRGDGWRLRKFPRSVQHVAQQAGAAEPRTSPNSCFSLIFSRQK
jgi:acetyl-CoA synthetase